MKPKQRNTHSSTIAIVILSLALSAMCIALLWTNWDKLSYGYHLVQWKMFPNQSPIYINKLTKEKIRSHFKTALTQTEMEMLQRRQNTVSAFFSPGTTAEQIFQIVSQLTEMDMVINIKYTSKQEAFESYKEMTKNDPLIQQMISPDILPESLDIELKNESDKGELKAFLSSIPQIEEIHDNSNPELQKLLQNLNP